MCAAARCGTTDAQSVARQKRTLRSPGSGLTPARLPLDLWFGYIQTSFWQANNREASSPFRETGYQPEIMAVAPLSLDLLGSKLRFVNLGLVHESNGQGFFLSRSWNRT